MQTSMSRAGRIAHPAEQRGKEPQQPNNESSPAPPRSTSKLCRHTHAYGTCCTHDGRRTIHNGNRILSHHTPLWSTRTVSVSLLSPSLRRHWWPWHTHQHVRNHLFFLPRTSHSSTAKRRSLLLSQIPIRHASYHIHQPTATQSVNVTQPPRTMPRTHQRGTTPLGASSVWTHRTGCPSEQQPPPSSEAGLFSNNQTTSPSSPPSAMHEVLPAPCIICDARTLNEHRRQYAPLDSTRSPLTILSQSSPWAMHKEHHGKNAQELICKPPTHSASINNVAPCLGFTRILACASLRGLPYTSHVVTVKKKQRLLSDRHPAAKIKAQSNKMPQIVTYSTQTIKRLCSKCTARKKSHAHKEATQRHSKRVGETAPNAILCGCK
ncbi:hypothetical protein TCDM_13265 [Trypanosoma cruzi Dm28c]|uniref:Uncharacterized protein n=1 Tax=Trypanosoma cruzi Dm28c TaxID=1416333 RepID=V5A3B4_TRYCR|nr:hypothetical protein TCDM_13265 [Trypanosoma cruzi Dm28c]